MMVERWRAQSPHVAQVGGVEALAKLASQAPGEPFEDPFAVVSPPLPCLLFLDDDPADLPVGPDHGRVDRLPGPIAGRGEDVTDLPVDRVEPGFNRLPRAGSRAVRGRLGRCFPGLFAFLRHGPRL